MKKKIEIEFVNELTEDNVNAFNMILDRAISDMAPQADIKKVSVDGNVYWLREKQP